MEAAGESVVGVIGSGSVPGGLAIKFVIFSGSGSPFSCCRVDRREVLGRRTQGECLRWERRPWS